MISKYFKTSFRHLWHNKLYAFINVSGLAIAITGLLLAVLYVKDEHSFDNFHSKEIHRVLTQRTDEKGERKWVAGTGQPQGPAFSAAVPEMEAYVRVLGGDIRQDVLANDKILNLQALFVDPNFFDFFSFPLLRGNKQQVLNELTSVVITETVARKYFNTIDVVGRQLNLEAEPSQQKLGKPMVVAGVAKDPPKNSSVRFDIVFPLKFMQLSFTDVAWLNHYLGTFFTLKPEASEAAVLKKFDQVFAMQAAGQVAESRKTYHFDPKVRYGMQAVRDIHLNPLPTGTGWREGGVVNESNPVFSYMFLGIAAFILLMAGINFINISIAGSLKRAREVGVRKIVGGSRAQIIFQFLMESTIICVVAFALSMMLTGLLLPLFNELTGKQLVINEALDATLVAACVGMLLVVIGLTGIYPAYVLSDFKPREVLYNRHRFSGRNFSGKVLVVLQFSLAVFFIISTLVYYRQMQFIRTTNLGYNPYQVIRTNIPGAREIKPVRDYLRNELAKEPTIRFVSFGGDGSLEEVKVGNNVVEAEHQVIDEYRLPVMELKLKAGRNISRTFPTDKTSAVIVNEAFVKAAGLTSPIGATIRTSEYFDKEPKTIVGVIADYHSGSLHKPIRPLVMFECDWYASGIWVKVEQQQQKKALAALERAYKKAMPSTLFHYDFLDELNEQQYLQEQRWQKIISIATLISMLICCLGLFGLAHLAAQQRIKEIGIRKVLGASVQSIARLLAKDFLLLVFVAFLVGSPMAWFALSRWLQDFAYRVNISWWIFLLAGTVAIIVACLTVSFQAVKAAIANPVSSLRSE
ncbi:MAG: ABC transporter permease [Ferruginibacter sp.]|nr:ABC transporter permease [Ferruginibacter sp.]